jgi:hypothetical protein
MKAADDKLLSSIMATKKQAIVLSDTDNPQARNDSSHPGAWEPVPSPASWCG